MLDLMCQLNGRGNTPYYQQLYLCIRRKIESGEIAPGTKLPSIREFSSTLHVSKTTIEEAYQQLLAEGYIMSQSRVGYYSLPFEGIFPTHDAQKPAVFRSVGDAIQNYIDIDFHPARVDTKHFPKNLWRKFYNEVWRESADRLLFYGNPQGESGLREEIAKYVGESRGVRCCADQVIIGSGLHYSIQLLTDVLRSRITSVGMEHPGYYKVQTIFERVGLPVQKIPLDPDGLNIPRLRAADVNLVYVTPSHQFPEGMVMPYAKRLQLLQWANENQGLIIEDDYDGEFRYTERPIPALQGLDTDDSVIYIGTFSKALAPGIRVNYMVIPRSLLNEFLQLLSQGDSPVSRIQQTVIQRFMEKHVRRMRRIYRAKHSALMESLLAEMENRVTVTGMGAGLHVALAVNTALSTDELIQRAESVGVKVYNLRNSLSDEPRDLPTIHLGFGGLSREQIQAGIKRLKTAWF
jgi:GntR family transcriptional regulator/MocR family aminotransferase